MTHSIAEQLMIELVNRARLDPLAEAARQGVDLNAGLAAGTISTTARQVLAPNTALQQAADAHSDWMLDTNTFSHAGAGGSTAGTRMANAGYTFSGAWGWSENLAWWGTTGSFDPVTVIREQHNGLYNSAGHRTNMFGTASREIGIGQELGPYDGYNSSMVTQNYAYSGTARFLTGVAIEDADGDLFYTPGEGRGGVSLAVDGGPQATSTAAGGYGLAAISAAGTVTVTVTAGGQQSRLDARFGSENIKLDVLVDAEGKAVKFLTSGSITLLDDTVRDIALLGVASARLVGSAGDDTLTGNGGSNVLDGGAGHDLIQGSGGTNRLLGGAGNDTMLGGSGNDTMLGGSGNDRLETGAGGTAQMSGQGGRDMLVGGNGNDVAFGGAGNDRLVLKGGNDRGRGGAGDDTIVAGAGDDRLWGDAGADRFDFARYHGSNRIEDFSLAEGDLLGLSQSLWLDSHGTLSAGQVISGFGSLDGSGNVVLDFGGAGTSVLLVGVTTLDGLADNLMLL